MHREMEWTSRYDLTQRWVYVRLQLADQICIYQEDHEKPGQKGLDTESHLQARPRELSNRWQVQRNWVERGKISAAIFTMRIQTVLTELLVMLLEERERKST
jgi:hypothetical protein